MNIGEGTTPIASHVTRKQIQRCPKGTYRNQQTGNCEPKSTLKKRTRPNCPKGTRRNKKTGLCETTAKKKELEKKHQDIPTPDAPKKIEPQEMKKSITPKNPEPQEMKKSITPKKIEPQEIKKMIAATMDLSKPVGVKKNPMSVEERVRLYEAKQTKAADAKAAEEQPAEDSSSLKLNPLRLNPLSRPRKYGMMSL